MTRLEVEGSTQFHRALVVKHLVIEVMCTLDEFDGITARGSQQ